jgi:hypothetical protein
MKNTEIIEKIFSKIKPTLIRTIRTSKDKYGESLVSTDWYKEDKIKEAIKLTLNYKNRKIKKEKENKEVKDILAEYYFDKLYSELNRKKQIKINKIILNC